MRESEREERTGSRRRGGRASRMMYRVVELGSNCVGKWPRLEPVRAVARAFVSPLKTVFNTSIFYAPQGFSGL